MLNFRKRGSSAWVGIGLLAVCCSTGAGAQTKVDHKHDFNHDLRCSISTEVGHWNRNGAKVISGTIENLTDHALDLKIGATVYLTPSRSGATDDKVWAPVDLFHDGPAKTERDGFDAGGKAVAIQSLPVVLQFKNGGDAIRFRVDAGHLLWAKAISSVWPSRELIDTIKSGDYDLQLVLETANGRVESPSAKISINAAILGTGLQSSEAEERDYWAHRIPKDMFPEAPEKAKTAECFRAFTPETSVNMVVKKCGRPDEELGSGIYIFVWHLKDGSTINIGTPYLERIGEIRYTDRNGKTSILQHAK